jgi:hypothetical protein
MSDERTERALERGFCGRLATVGADGAPYCTAMLYVRLDGDIYMHGTRTAGHLRANIDHEPRACLLVDAPGEIFDYGRFECDSTVSYTSIMVFGRIRVIEEGPIRQRFFETLMEKYRRSGPERPRGFFPRLDQIVLYRLTPERVTGKEIVLPDISGQWPALDRSKTPNARPPSTVGR